jgi:hypothetical protein
LRARASLYSPAFDISPASPDIELDKPDTLEWQWLVKPKSPGEHAIVVSVKGEDGIHINLTKLLGSDPDALITEETVTIRLRVSTEIGLDPKLEGLIKYGCGALAAVVAFLFGSGVVTTIWVKRLGRRGEPAQPSYAVESKPLADTKSAALVRHAAEGLASVEFPALMRPEVPPEAPPTPELVNWAVALYCFGLLSHFREMLRSFLFLSANGHTPASFLLARCLFEMGAHAYYTHKHVTQQLDAGDMGKAWEFLKEINMGSRYMVEEYGEFKEMPTFSVPREIGKVIRCFDEWLREFGKATTEYSFLSEFAHPNMAAFSHYYTMSPEESGFWKTIFHDPERIQERAPFAHASGAVIASLQFVVKLLERIGETQVAAQIRSVQETLHKVGSHSATQATSGT